MKKNENCLNLDKDLDYKNISSKAHSHCNSKPYTDCKYYNTELDPIYHCIKDSNIGICLFEKIDISKPERLEDFIDNYLDSLIRSKIIKE